MIDLHSHILHGLDDGSQSLEESIEMAKIAAEDGITKIVATPHMFRNNFDGNNIEAVNKARGELAASLQENDIKIELFIGAEVHISHNLIDEIKKNRTNMVINGSQYLLVEFPMSHIFSGIKELFFDLMSEGIIPIIAHPERNMMFMKNPSFLYEMLRMGVLTQANSGSFLGFYGRRAEETVNYFVSWNFIHFVGSDSHNNRTMAPKLSEAVMALQKRIGQDAVHALVWDNPQAVLDNEDIVFRPEPVNPAKDSKSIKINLPFFKKRKK